MNSKIENLLKEINWENWTIDNEYMDISEVLFSKLEWLKECIQPYIDENSEEHLDTINQVQELLKHINEKMFEN